jgi:hypothetical protein
MALKSEGPVNRFSHDGVRYLATGALNNSSFLSFCTIFIEHSKTYFSP